MSSPLKFYLGEESHYITEDYASRKTSIFADQYEKALRVIDAYIDAKDESSQTLQESRNNIVAFMGDRGTGKTSCMMSVLNMLEKHLEESKRNKTITAVDVVDPSFFDENTNIIYLVVGKMFAAFKESIDKSDEEDSKVHDLMTAFQEVLSQISMMGKSPLNENDTDVHQLKNLLVTVNLKKSLKRLVDCYLKYYGKDFLVIPVDDIDNNTDQAYKMMEQIRKYLIQPSIIILISFKLKQITNVAELYFMKLYETLITKSRIPTVDVADMAQKYLLKLFPLENRVTLPDLKAMMDKELYVYESREKERPILSGSSMKYTMTALIFKKTRYLFYHATGETSQIVPTNLREYRNLLSLLCDMGDYRATKVEYNKIQFRDYFYGEWVEKHLNEEGRTIARKLVENTEAGQFNKLVISLLSDYKPLSEIRIQEFQELMSEEETAESFENRNRRYIDSRYPRTQYEYVRILDEGNMSYNISVGDVFSVLNEWKKFLVSEEDKALLFFVESLYSIKLYHYYDEITEPEIVEDSKNSAIDNTIKRLDELEDVSNYEKLIGGAFFNPNLLRFLPFEGNAKNRKSRSYRVVNIKPLKDVIARCGSTDNAPSDLEFQLVEFFALTLSRRLEDKAKDSLSPFYRLASEVYYRTDLQKSQKAVFDLGSFFVSITDIQFAYNRLHPDLFGVAVNRANSLLSKLMVLTNAKYELGMKYNHNRFLSWCTIRNAVILQELGNSFSYVRTGRTPSSDQIDLLRDFFSQVTGFYIKTYDRSDDNTAYNIKFDYAIVYVELFNQIKTDNAALALFKQVFDGVETVADVETKPFIVDEIAHGLQNEVVKDTLIRRIYERTSITREDVDFWNAFNELITERKIPREQAEAVLAELKGRFNL